MKALRNSLPSGTAWLGGALFALVSASHCVAQQPNGWSPQPFAKPNTETTKVQQSVVPQNSLRPNDGQQNGDVLRWGTGNNALRAASPDKSFAQVMPPQVAQEKTASSQMVSTSRVVHQPVSSAATSPPKSSEPRSGFALSTAVNGNASSMQADEKTYRATNVQLASHNESSAVESTAPDSRTSGVWYDRNAAKDVNPAPRPNDSVREISTSRKTNVQNARFQEPPSSTPANLLPQGLPPATIQLPPTPGAIDNLLDRNSTRALNEVLEPIPAKPQVLPNKSGRSLLDPSQIPSSPFPGPKTTRDENDTQSPSDNREPPAINDLRESDPAPIPPRRVDRSAVDCDAGRQRVKDFDITRIRVDSSPSFVEGYKNRDRLGVNTKEGFIANAPIRPWLSYEGQLVAEAKLVDLTLGSVILEKADGTRMSFLLNKLSDADQIYVSEKWGVPVTCSVDDRSFPRRDFVDTTVTWKATGACHKPLYFEDIQLERYGHEWGPVVQPIMSSARFFGDVIVLPYKVGIHPMNECQYSLGHYRPGSCAPWTVGPVPISLRGALKQAEVVVGAGLILP